MYGKTYHEIGRFVPSTKTCSCCGHKLDFIGRNIKQWTCPSCNITHDRDINAGDNILQFGQIDLYGKILPLNWGVGVHIPMALQKFVH